MDADPTAVWQRRTGARLGTAAAAPPRRLFRSAGLVAAACLTLGALLSLLHPTVRAAALDGLRSLAASTASDENLLYHGTFTTPEEAAAAAGFTPPGIPDGPGRMGRLRVTTKKDSPVSEVRSVSFSYFYDGHAYSLTAEVRLVSDEAGRMVPHLPAMADLVRRAEQAGGDVRIVKLGDAEAVCYTRGRHGRVRGYCEWAWDEMRVRLHGPDPERVIELARLVKRN